MIAEFMALAGVLMIISLKSVIEMALITSWSSLRLQNPLKSFFIINIINIPLTIAIRISNKGLIVGPYARPWDIMQLNLFTGLIHALIGAALLYAYSKNVTVAIKSAVVFFVSGFFCSLILF